MSSSLVTSLAKVYDPKPLHAQKCGGRKPSVNGPDRSQASSSSSWPHDYALQHVEARMDSLSCQMAHLLSMQQSVLARLDGLSQELASLREEELQSRRGAAAARGELRGAVQRASERLEGVEGLVQGSQQVLSFIGEVVKSSRLVELLFKQPGSRKAKDEKDKGKLSLKGLKGQKKKKPPDTSDTSSLNEPSLQQVEQLNRQNTEQTQVNAEADVQRESGGGSGGKQEPTQLILNGPHGCTAPTPEREDREEEEEEEEEEEDIFEDSDEDGDEEQNVSAEPVGKVEDEEKDRKREREQGSESEQTQTDVSKESSEEAGDAAACSKRRVTGEELVKDDLKKSKVADVEGGEAQACRCEEAASRREAEAASRQEAEAAIRREAEAASRQEAEAASRQEAEPAAEETAEAAEETAEAAPAASEFLIDVSPPPLAPFEHRIVTPKPHQIATYYTINRDEVLGGGRFGQVHKCTENLSGLTLAAKIIKARSQKEKDVVRNEIQVMNQLNHANLIQLYAAFESRHDIVLVMEYVEGGELFDRIIDENYNLTELDTVLFIRQICEGLQYMHKMYILHLDLKPENILCVSRATNKIKIIDFGLARRYKPREKLKVNFGTPEFLAPEVINYEFVSFPTDMWSLGVITYMLLSGLSPFLGDDDNETLNNILACQWNFEEEEFADVSDEAKDFIVRLLVKSKSWRMSAAESLRHPWLSDRSLHHRLNQKKNKCHSTRAPSLENQTGESQMDSP
ncbi:myosin light chain kinase 2, skeletal/cardiac muscle isoform X2 [Betta splendens]|uniref:Myosin light chain kinase 2, skeletal/cardiac muscle isoform X2 n=1 Tax=Betta splendens TaxID=158456 RepID=A0A6P7MF51_BETSP|nr:myosin light chain kinase 2, skeletal/cardiac muscle isoform X2 [Betta splendens]